MVAGTFVTKINSKAQLSKALDCVAAHNADGGEKLLPPVLKDYLVWPGTSDETIIKTAAFYDTANGINDNDTTKTIIVELGDGTKVYRVPERTVQMTRGEDIIVEYMLLCKIKNDMYLSVLNQGGALETLDFLQKWTATSATGDDIKWLFEDDVTGYRNNKPICKGTAAQLLEAYDNDAANAEASVTKKPKAEKQKAAKRTPLAKKLRPSPTVSANDPSNHGKTLIGNDGKSYTSRPNCNGVHRWTKA
jgi:hypothetical protein